VWVALVLGGLPRPGNAADPPPPSTPPASGAPAPAAPPAGTPGSTVPAAAPAAIAPADIPARAEAIIAEIHQWETGLASPDDLNAITQDLHRLRGTLLLLSGRSAEDAGALSLRELDELARQWDGARQQLATWSETVAKRIQGLETGVARLQDVDGTWTRTADAAARDKLPPAITGEIAAVRGAVHDAQARAKEQRDTLLTLAAQIGVLQAKVTAGLTSLDAATASIHGSVFATDSPPLWVAVRDAAMPTQSVPAALGRFWEHNRTQLVEGVGTGPVPLSAQLLLLVALLAATFAARRSALAWPVDDPARQDVHAVVTRPVASAIVLAMLLRWPLARYGPVVLGEASALLIVTPLLLLLWDRLHRKLRTLVPVAVVLILIVSVWRVLPVASPEARILVALEDLVVLVWALWAVRPRQLARLTPSPRWQRWLLYAARVAAGALAVAFLANLVGNVALALVITRTVVGATFLGLLTYETRRIVSGLIVAALHRPGSRAPRAVSRHAPGLEQRALTTVRVAAAVAWAAGTLATAGLLGPVVAAARSVFGARLEIGTLSVSAADVLAFGLTVWLSLVTARVVRVVLEDDVLPRMQLPRGVPSAISTAANYAVLLVGFLLALSAAGLDLGRITILAGAFGVGIGFGLQTIVNNFVSGLILLFERPIRIGDVIDFNSVGGTVRRIGIRSCTIETFDGAEVIVPNGMLIANPVTNWTFSASQRRLEIRVGVSYGNDPAAVVALLERVAAEQPDVLRQPAPQAFFTGFAPGTLDFILRAWTARYDLVPAVRSGLGIAIHAALRDARIEIPKPPGPTPTS
jgi:small-conductance mechanosensitive channel